MKKNQEKFYSQFVKFIDQNKLIKSGDRVVVAVSGGPDSVCLLYLLRELKSERDIDIVVAHYNHSLRGKDAVRDEEFVKDLAEKWGIQFVCERARKGQIKGEEAARNLRYKFLEKVRGERGGESIAVAHNKGDLAETLLLNLVRGTGVRGLKSIAVKRDRIIRPLLFAQRQNIEKFLQDQGVKFRLDKTNDSPTFSRNFVRLKIMPLLKTLNPKVLDAFERTASVAKEYDDFVHENANVQLDKILDSKSSEMIVDRGKFIQLSPIIQSEIIRMLAQKFGVKSDFSAIHVEEILEMIKKNIGKKHKLINRRLKFALRSGKIIVSKERD